MSRQRLVIENESNVSYTNYKRQSADLLSQWLNSLETRSSLFWLRYIDNEFNDEEHEKRANSLESTDGTLSDIDVEDIEDDVDCSEVFPIPQCRSIAHRESDLLVALSENCTLGPVCYFCR